MIDPPIDSFRERVYELMRQLPSDKLTTYGDLAGMAGHPYAARTVGAIAHGGPTELPWHKVLNYRGGLAVGFPGGQIVQKQLLENDGFSCDEHWRIVDFDKRRWRS